MVELWQHDMERNWALVVRFIDGKLPRLQNAHAELSPIFREHPQGDPYFISWLEDKVHRFSDGKVCLTSLPSSSPGALFSLEGQGWSKTLFIGPTAVEWR